jgi:tetratricopeptide (TPR) repeat protein
MTDHPTIAEAAATTPMTVDPGDLTAGVGAIALGGTMLESWYETDRLRLRLAEARLAEDREDTNVAVAEYGSIRRDLGGRRTLPAEVQAVRASALAGLNRLGEGQRFAGQAARSFARVPRWLLGARELAEWALTLEDRDPERALDLHREAIRAGGAPAQSYHRLGLAAAAEGDEESLELLRQAAIAGPLDARIQLDHAQALARRGDSEEAFKALRAAASVFAYRGSSQAITVVASARELDRDDAAAKVLDADIARVFGDPRRAIDVLTSLRTPDGELSELQHVGLRVLSNAFRDLSRWHDALDALASPLAKAEVDAEDLFLAAYLTDRLGDRSRTRAYLMQALKINPLEIRLLRAVILDDLDHGDVRHAHRLIDDATAAGLNDPWARIAHTILRIGLPPQEASENEPDTEGDVEPDLESGVRDAIGRGMPAIDAWTEAAVLARRMGRRDVALKSLRAAASLQRTDPVLWRDVGDLARDLGRFDEALTALRKAIALRPGDADLAGRLGDALLSVGRIPQAMAELDRAVALPDPPAWVVATRGQVLLRQGSVKEAIKALEKGLQAQPSMPWAIVELARAYNRKGLGEPPLIRLKPFLATVRDDDRFDMIVSLARDPGLETALSVVDWCIDDLGNSRRRAHARPRFHAARGQILRLLGDDAAAIPSLRNAIRADANDANSHRELGLALAATGQNRAALSHVRHAAKLNPEDDDNAYAVAYVLMLSGHIEEAAAILGDAIERLGLKANLRALRAQLQLRLPDGDLQQALEDIRAVRIELGNEPSLDAHEGIILSRLDQDKDAAQPLERALKADPADSEVRSELVLVNLALGRPHEAIKHLKLLSDDPDPVIRGRRLALEGLAHAMLQEWEEAEKLLREGLALDATQKWALLELGRTIWNRTGAEGALPYVERAIRLGEDADNRAVHGLLLSEIGRTTEAMQSLERAIELDPKRSDVRTSLADILLERGQGFEAFAALGPAVGEGLDVGLKRVEVLYALGESEQAAQLIDRLLEMDHGPETLATLVFAQTKWDRDVHAVELLQRFEITPRPSDLPRLVGGLLSTIGEFEVAIGVLERARAANRRDKELAPELGWAYSNLGPPYRRASLEAWRRARRQSGDAAWLLKGEANILRSQGRTAAANKLYERAIERMMASTDETEFDKLWFRGWCEYAMDHYDLAIPYFVRATTIPHTRASGDRFDLALTLLAAGREADAEVEYRRSIDELDRVPDRLRQRGLLCVAVADVAELSEIRPHVAAMASMPRLMEALARALGERDDDRRAIGPFLKRMRAFGSPVEEVVPSAAEARRGSKEPVASTS